MDFRSPFAGLGDVFYLIDFYEVDGFEQTDYLGLESVARLQEALPEKFFPDTRRLDAAP